MALTRRTKIQILAGIPLFFLVAVVAVFFGYKEFKSWRADIIAKEATILLDKGEVIEAWNLARSAYFLDPDSLTVTRTLARVADSGDPSLAPGHWAEAVKLSDGARQDRLGLALASLKTGQMEVASGQLEKLKQINPDDGEILMLESRLLARQGFVSQAVSKAENAISDTSISKESHFYYVQLTQYSQDAEVRQSGIDHLLNLAGRKDDLGLSALRNIANYSQLSADELSEVSVFLASHPLKERSDELLRYEVLLRIPGYSREEVVDSAIEEFNLELESDLLELGRWLNQNGLYEFTTKIMDQTDASSRKDLFLIYMDALAFQGQWELIDNLLSRPRVPLEEFARHLFMMRVYLQDNESRKAQLAWDKALLSASVNSDQLWYLARYAQRLGLSSYTKMALKKLVLLPATKRKAYETWLMLERNQGNTQALLMIYEEMLREYPADNTILNDTIYLGLILENDLDSKLAEAIKLVEENPLYLEHRIVLSLALLKNNQVDRALEILRPLKVDWSAIESRWQVVFARILQVNGYSRQAAEYAASIDKTGLLPEEMEMLNRILTS